MNSRPTLCSAVHPEWLFLLFPLAGSAELQNPAPGDNSEQWLWSLYSFCFFVVSPSFPPPTNFLLASFSCCFEEFVFGLPAPPPTPSTSLNPQHTSTNLDASSESERQQDGLTAREQELKKEASLLLFLKQWCFRERGNPSLGCVLLIYLCTTSAFSLLPT